MKPEGEMQAMRNQKLWALLTTYLENSDATRLLRAWLVTIRICASIHIEDEGGARRTLEIGERPLENLGVENSIVCRVAIYW